VPLLILTLVGIAISSASIYAFAESLKLGEYLERKHAHHMERLQNALRRNPTSIVTVWSFLPIVPTDLICYVCGAMRISFRRFLLGVLVGEGAICALYIFGGSHLLDVGTRLFAADARAGANRCGRATLGRSGLRRALCALPRAGRRTHPASLGAAEAAGRTHRARARRGGDARDRDVDESRRAARCRRLSRHRRARLGPVCSRVLLRPRSDAGRNWSATSWNGWSPTQDNARYQTAQRAGLRAEQVPSLELKWAYGFADDVTAFCGADGRRRACVRR
jgi:hypothetical protein